VSPGLIGSTGTFYFLGWGISSVIVPRLSDSSAGRRKPYLCSLACGLILYLMIVISPNIYITIIYFFGIGLCQGGRAIVGLSYMNEFIPEKYRNLTGTIFLLGDTCVLFY
jgi:MFS family permease